MRRRLLLLALVVTTVASTSSCVAFAQLCGTCCLSCANGGGPVPEDQQLPEAPPSTATVSARLAY